MELFSETRIIELEEKIDRLIAGYLAMKQEHGEALQKLVSLESDNKDLQEKFSAAKNEREVIIDKVTKLLEKVEKIEA